MAEWEFPQRPWREEHCPERGAVLTHSVDTAKRPDGHCLECGSDVSTPWGGVRKDPIEYGFAATDNHRTALCCVGNHLAPLCHRVGDGPTVRMVCDIHIARIIAQVGRNA